MPETTWIARRRSTVFAVLLVTAALAGPPARAAEEAPLRPRAKPVKSLLFALGPLDHQTDPRLLVVKLPDGASLAASGGRLLAAGEASGARNLAGRIAGALSIAPGASVEPLIQVPKPLLDELRRAGEANCGEELADLSQYYRVRVPPGKGPALLAALLALPEVENAYAPRGMKPPADIPPTTPDLSGLQGYRAPAPGGIDIAAAWAKGLRGQGVTVADVEFFWNLHHEDLGQLASQVPPVGIVPESDWLAQSFLEDIHHGTASLGVLAAGDNGYGTTGLVPDAKFRVAPAFRRSAPAWDPANAVVQTTLALKKGDVILIELETSDGFPFEIDDAEFAVVRQATALGIHVVEPAGNTPGGTLLDPFAAFDWRLRDSGAILVAGGLSSVTSGIFHGRYPNSNFGHRIDTYAWGQNIATLGYGPDPGTVLPLLANCATASDAFPLSPHDLDQYYTRCFNGTSGAGAIVAGAVAALEQQVVAKWGRPASSPEMRNLLRLGTPGGFGIGHQADLAYQLDLLKAGTVPHVYQAEPSDPAVSEQPEVGGAVAGPGDVDGDGLADVAVGAPGYRVPGATPLVQAGRVYLYSSKTGKLLWTSTGSAAGDRFGQSLAAFGDLNGDGAGDLAAAAPYANGGKGLVRILSGRTGQVLATLQGSSTDEHFGWALAATRGVDRGSDPSDLIVGVPGASGGGRVELYSGYDGSFLADYGPQLAGTDFGVAVAGGDVDGDGEGDVLVGAPSEKNASGVKVGAVHAFPGHHPFEIFTLFGEAPTAVSSNQFGAAVAGVGDLNGDGLDDFAVGAPNWTKTFAQPGFGQVYVYKSKDAGPALLWTFTGAKKASRLGTSVAGVGDWNGDGQLDVAAGEPGIRGGFPELPPPGKVRIFLGPFRGLVVRPTEPRVVVTPTGPGERAFATKDTDTQLGWAVAAVGDTNGDGWPDVAAGEPKFEDQGRALVLASAPAGAATSTVRLVAETGVIEANDFDHDGFSGGGGSPSSSILHIDAGPAWAGAGYRIAGFVKPPFDTNAGANGLVAPASPSLHDFTGTLDANGKSSVPIFGPVPRATVCPALIGAEFGFLATVGFDTNGDGVFDSSALSNAATVTIIHELAGC